MGTQLVLILGLCTLGLCGHVTSAMALPQEDTQSSQTTSTEDKSVNIRSSLDRLQNYLYDLKEKLDRVRQLYDEGEVFGRGDDNRAVISKRKSPSSGFHFVRGRRAEDEASDMAEQPMEHGGDLMSLLEYYRALHNNKRTMLDNRQPGNKRQPPPRGFHAVRGKRSLH